MDKYTFPSTLKSGVKRSIELVEHCNKEHVKGGISDVDVVINAMKRNGIMGEDKLKEIMRKSKNSREQCIARSFGWDHIYDNALELFKQN